MLNIEIKAAHNRNKLSNSIMLQHSATDFYDLSVSSGGRAPQHTPPYSPGGGSVHNNNNNNTISENNNNITSVSIGQNGATTPSNDNRESLPSFGFTQEQVACVCEVGSLFCYVYFCYLLNSLTQLIKGVTTSW